MRRSNSAIARRLGGVTHYVYTATGPSGVYVGCTSDLRDRIYGHRSSVNPRSTGCRTALTPAMQRDGVNAYVFDVVATCRNRDDGRATEAAIIEQVRRGGDVPLLNREHAGNRRPHRPRTDPPSRAVAELIAWRERTGLSQQDAADMLEISQPFLSRLECGRVGRVGLEVACNARSVIGIPLTAWQEPAQHNATAPRAA